MALARARVVFAGLLIASTTALTGAPAAAAPASPATTLGPATTVTLVTGDVVTLGGPLGADVAPARGREPALVVDAPAEYTFDARDGVPLGFTVDRPEARSARALIQNTITTDWGPTGSYRGLPDFDTVRVRPSRTSAPGDVAFLMQAQLARPAAGGGFHASPYLYNLRFTDGARVPADLVRRVTDRQLARVVSAHAVAAPGKIGIRERFLPMPLPFTLTEYYTPGTAWRPQFQEAASADEFPPSGVQNIANPRSYQLGRTARERWNVGVFGPSFASDTEIPATLTARLGDEVQFSAGLYTDQNPDTHGSTPDFESADTVILRDGAVIADYPAVGYIFTELPPEEATYTVRTTATRSGPLSTRIDGEWTFRSAHTGGASPTPIPVLAVRFAPNLDDHNTAPAGRTFRFPVSVQRNGAGRPGRVNTPVVEISYDDGATWRPVRLVRDHGRWQASVHHPGGAGYASLRWSVSDPAGNQARATVVHAYALR